jgi:hypothetical protein
MTISQEQVVRAALAPFETALYEAFHAAWQDWHDLALGGKLKFVARSRACLVYDFLVQRIMAALSGDQSVHVIEGDETVKLVFGGAVALRFKKANENGLGSNIKTQATLGFVDQQQELPGMPGVHKVEMVYVLNRLQTKIDQVMVVARDGDACLWNYEIAPNRTASIVPMPQPQSTNGDRGVRIKLRALTEDMKREAGEK